jgi:hypothetical protein
MTASTVEKIFYFSKLVTVFGRVPAISLICFMCRISCEAISWNHSYVFSVPKNGCGIRYLLRSRSLVSSMNAKVLSRTCRNSASISSFSWTISGSSGIGVFRRIRRDLTTAIGTCSRLKKGTDFGGFLRTLSVLLMIVRSMVIRWLTSSPADQRPSAGLVFHWSAGTASVARRSSLCARARFSMMVASAGTDSFKKTRKVRRLRPQLARKRGPVAGRAPLQTALQRSAGLPPGFRQFYRMVRKCPGPPPVTL